MKKKKLFFCHSLCPRKTPLLPSGIEVEDALLETPVMSVEANRRAPAFPPSLLRAVARFQ